MDKYSYQQLIQARDLSRYWTFEMKRQRKILRDMDATYLSEQVLGVWLRLRRETLETLSMHEDQLKQVNAEIRRRNQLVGFM